MSESPTAYIIETFVQGYLPSRIVFGPDEFDEAYGLYESLTALAEPEQDTVRWSVEY